MAEDHDTAEIVAARLSGRGACYVCGVQQWGSPHFGCTTRYGLNDDLQALLRRLEDLETQLEEVDRDDGGGWRG